MLDIKCSTPKGQYLGVPLIKGRLSVDYFLELREKINKALSGWMRNSLNVAGRVVLITSIFNALPSYLSQICMLPTALLKVLDKAKRNFFWDHDDK